VQLFPLPGVDASGTVAALPGPSCHRSLQRLQGHLLFGVRLLVGVSMLLSIVLAVITVKHRDKASHRAWMIRG